MLFRIALRNVLRGWRRSGIVIGAIAFGLGACLLLVGWTNGLAFQMVDNVVRAHAAHVVVQAAGYERDPGVTRGLGERADRIASLLAERPGTHVARRLVGDGLAQSARRSVRALVVGADPAREAEVSSVPGHIVDGVWLDAPSRGRLPPVVVGADMVERLHLRLGGKLVLHVPGATGAGAFRVRGIYRTASAEFDRAFVFLRLEDAQNLFDVPGGVTQLAVALEGSHEEEAFQAWARTLLGAEPGLEILTWRQRLPQLATLVDQMRSVGWVIYGLVFIATGFGIANALLMAVYERIREFGVMRSLGLRATRILWLVLAEAFLITIVGTALGLAFGVLLTQTLGTGVDLARFAEGLRGYGIGTVIYPRLLPSDFISPVALAAVTAGVAGLWPALRAIRMRPAEAVRHT